MCRSGEDCFNKYHNINKEFKILDSMLTLSGALDWSAATDKEQIMLNCKHFVATLFCSTVDACCSRCDQVQLLLCDAFGRLGSAHCHGLRHVYCALLLQSPDTLLAHYAALGTAHRVLLVFATGTAQKGIMAALLTAEGVPKTQMMDSRELYDVWFELKKAALGGRHLPMVQ